MFKLAKLCTRAVVGAAVISGLVLTAPATAAPERAADQSTSVSAPAERCGQRLGRDYPPTRVYLCTNAVPDPRGGLYIYLRATAYGSQTYLRAVWVTYANPDFTYVIDYFPGPTGDIYDEFPRTGSLKFAACSISAGCGALS
jgi:hypothetical protein